MFILHVWLFDIHAVRLDINTAMRTHVVFVYIIYLFIPDNTA